MLYKIADRIEEEYGPIDCNKSIANAFEPFGIMAGIGVVMAIIWAAIFG